MVLWFVEVVGREGVRVCDEVGREAGTPLVCFGSRWVPLPATGEAVLAGAGLWPSRGERCRPVDFSPLPEL